MSPTSLAVSAAPQRTRVSPVANHVQRRAVLGVDHPQEEKTVLLHDMQRDRRDGRVVQTGVGDGHLRVRHAQESNAAHGVVGRQLPWRVHHDHVEEAPGERALLRREPLAVSVCRRTHCPVEVPNVRADTNAPLLVALVVAEPARREHPCTLRERRSDTVILLDGDRLAVPLHHRGDRPVVPFDHLLELEIGRNANDLVLQLQLLRGETDISDIGIGVEVIGSVPPLEVKWGIETHLDQLL